LALRRAVDGVAQVCIVGEDAKARELELAALRGFAANRSVIRLPNLTALPPALRETLPHLPKVDGSFAVVCKGRSCLPPVVTVDDLLASLVS
jgi:uncharacterized protein YyaL (SSP411 family)